VIFLMVKFQKIFIYLFIYWEKEKGWIFLMVKIPQKINFFFFFFFWFGERKGLDKEK
jgi:hypothetical protein